VVEAQEPADALVADDRPGPHGVGCRLDELTLEALVVALGVVVGNVFSDGCATGPADRLARTPSRTPVAMVIASFGDERSV
jgi:hypothetical protein